MLKSKLAAVAAFAASIALPAHAATRSPCVSPEDARILTLQIMPILIDKAESAAARTCRQAPI